MQEKIKSLFRPSCEDRFNIYQSAEEAKRAKLRNKQISRVLKQHKKEELKKLKILLLGTAESGKSTITKQMKIIHNNGFDLSERLEKISDIRRNIQQSIVVLLSAMDKMRIPLANQDNEDSRNFILKEAGDPESHRRNELLDHAEKLWADAGVKECYSRSHEYTYQLIDCAKYFLDKIFEIKNPAFVPSDQDILRCRSLTASIQHIEFEVPDGGTQVKFDVYDVGGQQGERKKWIQVFDSVTAILFVVDCSSFDQTLREDPTKNRLLEALENFEQVWNNRFLKYVSILLFINKIDMLAEKIARGRDIAELTRLYPDLFPDFDTFTPSRSDILEFLEAYPSYNSETTKKSRSVSRCDVHPDTIKTAVYIKHLFMKIVRGELQLKQRITQQTSHWHDGHSCEYFYTCAIDTNNVQPEEAKKAKRRNKQISKTLKQHQKEELKKLKLLLLGTAESGKSTIAKQMKIIHGNGFDMRERLEKISDIRRNIQQSIVVLLTAMKEMEIPFAENENEKRRDFILSQAGNPESHKANAFLEHAEQLWADAGVQECYNRSHEFQLIDCAKYFLDKIPEIKKEEYIPSDQDILRCRSLTNSIQHTEFSVPEGDHQVKFDVYDVGGQQGERKKWIQVFDSVNAILFAVDCSSFDQTLREDPTKNRLLEALENFEQVWNNRFLKNVSVLLFINKIDVLAEKIARGRDISELTKMYPHIFPDFKTFTPSKSEVLQFLQSYPEYNTVSENAVHPDTVKTAVYIKSLFMKIVQGELQLKERITMRDSAWHCGHSCEYFYTCAIDTNNVQKVLNGCRSLIIQDHLRKFGLL
ncbi:uncharacterized protein LOC111134396 [Crassostrea virginica]